MTMGKGSACVCLLGHGGVPLPCGGSEQQLSGEEVALSCRCEDEGENPRCHSIVYIHVNVCKGLMLLISPGCPGSRDSTLISI